MIYDKTCSECGHGIRPLDPPAERVESDSEPRWRHAPPCPEPSIAVPPTGLIALARDVARSALRL
jgi:hypothetical protein